MKRFWRIAFHTGAAISLLLALIAVAMTIDGATHHNALSVCPQWSRVRDRNAEGRMREWFTSYGVVYDAADISVSRTCFFTTEPEPPLPSWRLVRCSCPFNWPLRKWRGGIIHENMHFGFESFFMCVPHWQVVLLCLPWPGWWCVLWRKSRAMRRAGCCANCGYDLRGNTAGAACPECGAKIPTAALK